MRPVVLIPMTLLPSFLLSAKISLGDIQSRCLSLLEPRLHVLGEQKEGREEDERAFLGVSCFFPSSHRERAALLDQFFPEQGVSCFVILVRFWKDNYPPNLIICILRTPTQRTCSRLGRDGRERDESRV